MDKRQQLRDDLRRELTRIERDKVKTDVGAGEVLLTLRRHGYPRMTIDQALSTAWQILFGGKDKGETE